MTIHKEPKYFAKRFLPEADPQSQDCWHIWASTQSFPLQSQLLPQVGASAGTQRRHCFPNCRYQHLRLQSGTEAHCPARTPFYTPESKKKARDSPRLAREHSASTRIIFQLEACKIRSRSSSHKKILIIHLSKNST